ncbi:hypothetical protein E6O75_ATG10090 [Venturia nashicola]|uniref:Uncharacterized protein n=1 Tax=Venturia nashicola TaxID=86259 RepID=A0A4Z1NK15_9PEZI|nr:hypothetical protein E6O75_ATG10090 [Venturia nashicola]
MERMRGIWEEEARDKTTSSRNTGKRNKKKDKRRGKAELLGTPTHDYPTYHASTIALLKPDADALNSLYHTYKFKRQALGRSISERSSMVNLKAGNTLAGMVEEMITPGPEETGEQVYREAEADRRIEKEEERMWDEEIEGGRVRVGVEGWGGRNWGRRESV